MGEMCKCQNTFNSISENASGYKRFAFAKGQFVNTDSSQVARILPKSSTLEQQHLDEHVSLSVSPLITFSLQFVIYDKSQSFYDKAAYLGGRI